MANPSKSKNSGRSTTGGPAVPYYPASQRIEAAKYLRLVVTRYINDRASLREIDEAMTFLRQALYANPEAK